MKNAKMYTKYLSERIPTACKNPTIVIIAKKGNKNNRQNYRPICLQSISNEKAGEDSRRKPATRASWIQKQILNDRPHPRRKSTVEMPRI